MFNYEKRLHHKPAKRLPQTGGPFSPPLSLSVYCHQVLSSIVDMADARMSTIRDKDLMNNQFGFICKRITPLISVIGQFFGSSGFVGTAVAKVMASRDESEKETRLSAMFEVKRHRD
ncbi:MAG: hypothetical protein ABI977_09430 [Acidobacteriota bacterium]